MIHNRKIPNKNLSIIQVDNDDVESQMTSEEQQQKEILKVIEQDEQEMKNSIKTYKSNKIVIQFNEFKEWFLNSSSFWHDSSPKDKLTLYISKCVKISIGLCILFVLIYAFTFAMETNKIQSVSDRMKKIVKVISPIEINEPYTINSFQSIYKCIEVVDKNNITIYSDHEILIYSDTKQWIDSLKQLIEQHKDWEFFHVSLLSYESWSPNSNTLNSHKFWNFPCVCSFLGDDNTPIQGFNMKLSNNFYSKNARIEYTLPFFTEDTLIQDIKIPTIIEYDDIDLNSIVIELYEPRAILSAVLCKEIIHS